MAFKVVLSGEALSEFKKFDNLVVETIFTELEKDACDLYRFFSRLSGREDYKLRVGDYRIIAGIMNGEQTVFVVTVGHRKNVY